VREAERPAGDEIAKGNDDERPRRADPRVGPGTDDDARDDGRAKRLERRVKHRERAEQDENIDGVGREEDDEKCSHRDRHHQGVVKPREINGGKTGGTQPRAIAAAVAGMKDRGGDGHKRAGRDEAADFVFDGFRNVKGLFQYRRHGHAGGVFHKAGGDEQQGGHPKQRVCIPMESGFLLGRSGVEILPSSDHAHTHERRNRNSSDQGNGLGELLAGQICVRGRGKVRCGGAGGQQRYAQTNDDEG
jgi:hypothetical protein